MEKEQLIALVKKSKSGDTEAIEKLLQYAHTSVSYQCRKMLNNEQDAEDITQEVLVTIYTKLDTLQEPAAFHKWVNQITASRCINALNRTHVEYQFAEDEEGHSILDNLEELDEQAIPDKAIDNAETARMIEEIVGSLPDAQRAATLMFYYNEMSVKEIATAMNVSENTVKSRLNYARKAIKEKVLDYEKQGVKLYGLSPLPFLLYFLRLAAQNSADKDAAGIMVTEVMAAKGTAVGAASASAAGAGGAAAAAGGGVATATATTTATGIFAGISAKVVAGVLAAVVTIGSVAAVVIPNTQADTAEPAVVPTEAISITATESVPETEIPTTEAPTEELTEAPTEAPAEESETVETTPAECNHDYKTTVIAPTQSTQGYTLYECKNCGYEYKSDYTAKLPTESEPTCNHNYTSEHISPACIEDPSNQDRCDVVHTLKYTCTKCGDSYTGMYQVPHDWGAWIVTTEPTTENNGGETRWCQDERCQTFEGRVIPKLPADETEPAHQHSYERIVTTPPTCSYGGEATYTCSCGHSYKEDIPKNEHVWSEWVVTKEPTTTSYGQKVRECELCHGAQFESIDPLPAD